MRTTGTRRRTGCFMEHIAMLENADDPATTTTWKEHVSDDEFHGTRNGG